MNRKVSSALAIAATLWLSQTASALLVADGIYRLGNHPDGSQSPPPYGLRLDGLDGITSHRFTFDFEYDDGTQQSAMFLNLDKSAGTIHIFGSAYGGLNDPSNTNVYAAASTGHVGWWDIDFTYSINVTSFVGGDGYGLDDVYVSNQNPANNGTISAQFSSASYSLTDKSDGNLSFRFGDDSTSPGHRGYAGISGWGWMNHSGYPTHVAASDWLFTAEMVPVPGGFVLGLAGLGLVGLLRRRTA